MKATALALLLALTFPAAAADPLEPLEPLVPEYEITLQDAGTLKRVVNENAWMGDFAGTNLYRGAMVRLGPILFAMGEKGSDAWSGRLVDFLVAKFLDGRPARLAYFDAPGLVSPFGVTLPALTTPQREAARLLVTGLRSGSDVTVTIATGEETSESVEVTPVSLKLQKLAAVVSGECLVVARDPHVAASLSLRCAASKAPTAPSAVRPAAHLAVDVSQLFPAGRVVVEKTIGLEGRVGVDFDFDPVAARFIPTHAELPVTPDHVVRETPLDDAVVGALPAGTLFFGSLAIPDPGTLDLPSLESFLRTVREKPPAGSRTVTIASLGTRYDDRKDQPLTVLLLRRPAGDGPGLETVFTRTDSWPVTISTACPGLLVLSPSDDAIASVVAACSGKAPSLKNLPPLLLARLTSGPASATVYLNAGRFFASALELGWARRGPKGEAPPPEVSSALALLDRLPSYALSGRVEGKELRMRAATHSPAGPALKAAGRKP